MSFLVVGKGVMNIEELKKQLMDWGIVDPFPVIKEAQKGRTVCGNFNILAVK